MKAKLPCGCVHTDTAWFVMCPAHDAEHAELHLAARERRSAVEPGSLPPVIYPAVQAAGDDWITE